MLTGDQLDALTDPVVALYQDYMDSVLVDIARRIGKLDFAKPTAAWQMQRLIESGAIYEGALDRLASMTGQSEAVLRAMFKKAGVKALRFDDAIYQAAGLNPLPLHLSPAMAQVLAAGLRKTNGVMRNLTLSTALDAQNAFIEASDLAYLQVASGAFDYNTAIRNSVTQLADRGLETVMFPGRKDQLDVAVRRSVLTGINQTAGQLQWQRADEMDCDLVEVSAHMGARPTHQVWQGKVFSRSGLSQKYPNFVEETGYGTATGLMGVNCRHSFYPFFEGISERAYSKAELDSYAHKTVKYNGQVMSQYDATQQQRGIERTIREWKRRRDVLTASGQDSSAETAKVKEWQARARDFTKQTGLQRQPEREWAGKSVGPKKTVGFSFVPSGTTYKSMKQARARGVSDDGWEKYEKKFKAQYLEQFDLKDDVERTFGFWGGPEPSFNAYLLGKRENMIEMAKAWGRDHNQAGMVVLIPNPKGTGGKLIWNFGRELSDGELDDFFSVLDELNQEFGEEFKDYFGVTVKGSRNIEYWFKDGVQQKNARFIIERAIQKINLPAAYDRKVGFDFILLERGKDY